MNKLSNHISKDESYEIKKHYIISLIFISAIDGEISEEELNYLKLLGETFNISIDEILTNLSCDKNEISMKIEKLFDLLTKDKDKLAFIVDCLILAHSDGTYCDNEKEIILEYFKFLNIGNNIEYLEKFVLDVHNKDVENITKFITMFHIDINIFDYVFDYFNLDKDLIKQTFEEVKIDEKNRQLQIEEQNIIQEQQNKTLQIKNDKDMALSRLNWMLSSAKKMLNHLTAEKYTYYISFFRNSHERWEQNYLYKKVSECNDNINRYREEITNTSTYKDENIPRSLASSTLCYWERERDDNDRYWNGSDEVKNELQEATDDTIELIQDIKNKIDEFERKVTYNMQENIGKEFTRNDGKIFILTDKGLKEEGKKLPSYDYEKSLEVLKDPALFAGLQGSAFNYSDNVVMRSNQGHGFAAEKMNNMYDNLSGKDATIIGGDNAKNGADRLVDGVNIQTKYCKTGSRCVNEAFDKQTGDMKYINSDGTPMQIEVPSDKYQDAINSMEDKIRKGKVPGVTDPKEAENIIKKGEFTYQQAVNMTKFGTIESLTYDAINGVRIAGTTMGISSVISFSVAIWNGEDFDKALKSSIYSGLKVGGIAWAGSILTAQLGRTGLEQALRGTTDYLVKSMGSKAYHFLANGLRSSGKIYGAAAINNVSKVLRGNVVTGIATTVVMSVPDFYRMFNGKMSGAQVFKNVAKTGAGVAGGVGGWMGGAAAGAAVGSAVPVIGTAVGGIVGGLIGSFAGGTAGSKVAEVTLDQFIEDDANEMMEIVESVFGQLAFDYLLNEKEAEKAIEKFSKKDIPELLMNMYASSYREEYATIEIEPIIEDIVKNRKKIKLPTNQQIIDNMGEVLEELAG